MKGPQPFRQVQKAPPTWKWSCFQTEGMLLWVRFTLPSLVSGFTAWIP